MKHRAFSDPSIPRLQQAATILGMLDDLGKVFRTLETDIAAEKPTTPLFESLFSRHAKLRETIATLEARLAGLRSAEAA
jgi:hypothetical protein